MVKYVPEVSSWQLLFVRCSMQVRIKSGDLREVEVTLAFPQLVTMLPLVYLSGQNIMGTPDLATRYLKIHKFLVNLGIISSKTQVESSCSRDPWRVSSSHDI